MSFNVRCLPSPFYFFNLFLIGGQLLYNIVLVSALHQHESAIGTHMSPRSGTSLPPPTLSHPPRLSQSPGLSFLSHTENSHWLSVLHVVVCNMLPCYSPFISPSPPTVLSMWSWKLTWLDIFLAVFFGT